MDGLDKLLDARKTRVVQCLALQDAKPDFDLVEPAGTGGGEVKNHVWVCGQPLVVSLVGIGVVQDDVDLPVGGLLGNNDLVHESLEVGTPLGLRGLTPNEAGDHLQGRANKLTVPWRL